MLIKFPVTIEDVKKSPYAVLIIILLTGVAYFINREAGANDNCDNKILAKDKYIQQLQREKDSIAGKYFNVVLELAQEKTYSIKKDSILRTKTEDQAKQIIQKN